MKKWTLRVVRSGQPFIGRQMHVAMDRRGNGVEDGYFDFVYQSVLGPSGINEGVLVVGRDVTDEVLTRREAEREERRQAEFEQQLIGIVSHDLRTPLQSVLFGVAALVRREDLDEKAVKTVVRIQSSAERMSRLVKHLLDFTLARLGDGIPLSPKATDLNSLVQTVIDEIQSSHPDRILRVEEQGIAEGTWDADRLAQVIQNLVSNALHYSPEDTAVTVRTHGFNNHVVLEVHNHGASIAPEALQIIFEPLQRATSSQKYKAGRSVGLGLYIVKHLVQAHGGEIDVRSTAFEGTTFVVTLPRG